MACPSHRTEQPWRRPGQLSAGCAKGSKNPRLHCMRVASVVARQAGEMTELTSETRAQLKTVSTATLMSCLFKRGLRNQYIQNVRPLTPDAGTMVGEAFTLRYMPAREDLNPMSVFQNP